MTTLDLPETGLEPAERFVSEHLAHLCCDGVRGSASFRGGAAAAESALGAFDVSGYARSRSEVSPPKSRGASHLSPYIRHGLLDLRRVWRSVEGGPAKDVARFRDELLWQEYARHWYATHGAGTRIGIRRELPGSGGPGSWEQDMECISGSTHELHEHGWLVNQQRMWMASHWAVRNGFDWRLGEDDFFRHLLDGSRAANRLGWQWVTGIGSAKPYGFSRWQVEKRAAGTCARCRHEAACPIANWPPDPSYVEHHHDHSERGDSLFGPPHADRSGRPDWVWLTAESLGDDPALAANPELPVVFVFDEPLLGRLRLSSKRLVFLVETLAEIGARRHLAVRLGDPATELTKLDLAVTHAPVPGFARLRSQLNVLETHPWPWLCQPGNGRVSSFSSWRRSVEEPR